jgi:hypothetical protein
MLCRRRFLASLRRFAASDVRYAGARLRRIVPLFFIERPVELEPIEQHDDRLGPALAFIHRESDRLAPIREQASAKVLGVFPADSGFSPQQSRL